MPELPEVETVRRGLAQAMTGATFTTVSQHRPDLRFPFPDRFAERLTGRRIETSAVAPNIWCSISTRVSCWRPISA